MKPIVILIVKYLRNQLESGNLTPDAAEGVEVAIQCIESAYNITADELRSCITSLEELYSLHASVAAGNHITEEQREEAENLKLVGNNLMRHGKFEDAIGLYSRAIEIDAHNAVYYCNRAAAHIKLSNFNEAVSDCNEAIRIDPSYSKAHSRLGYAYSAMGNNAKAKECYKKALEIEPENESYKASLQSLEEQLAGPSSGQYPDLAGLLPGLDLTALFRNPSFMSVASQMLADPGMQNVVSRLLSSQSFPLGNVEDLISAGQQLADRLQQQTETTPRKDGPSGEGDNIARPAGDTQSNGVPDLRPQGGDDVQAAGSSVQTQDAIPGQQENLSNQVQGGSEDHTNNTQAHDLPQQAPMQQEQQPVGSTGVHQDEMDLLEVDIGGGGDGCGEKTPSKKHGRN